MMNTKPVHLAMILGTGFAVAGTFAFLNPLTFFSLLGDYYGAFNLHFVQDAGIAFFSSGVLLWLSVFFSHWRTPLILGGSLFVVLHGALHIQMLIIGMAPSALDVIKELVVIILPSLLSLTLLIWQLRFSKTENESVNT